MTMNSYNIGRVLITLADDSDYIDWWFLTDDSDYFSWEFW